MADIMVDAVAAVSRPPPPSPADREAVLGAVRAHSPRVPQAVADAAGAPAITLAEVWWAVSHSKPGTAPGPDGIPVDVWRKLGEPAYELLAAVFTAVGTTVVGPEQTAFLAGRRIADNICLTQMLPGLLAANAAEGVGPTGAALALLDFRKAYDTIDRGFLLAVMEAVGTGDGVLAWTRTILTHTYASANVNGFISARRCCAAGVRQGCPAAPAFFLFLGHALSCFLRTCPAVGVEVVPGCRVVCPQYADDCMPLLRSCAPADVAALVEAMAVFGLATGLVLNLGKCGILPLGSAGAGLVAGAQVAGLRVLDAGVSLGVPVSAGLPPPEGVTGVCRERLAAAYTKVARFPMSSFGMAHATATYGVSRISFRAVHCGMTPEAVRLLSRCTAVLVDQHVGPTPPATLPGWASSVPGVPARLLLGRPAHGGFGAPAWMETVHGQWAIHLACLFGAWAAGAPHLLLRAPRAGEGGGSGGGGGSGSGGGGRAGGAGTADEPRWVGFAHGPGVVGKLTCKLAVALQLRAVVDERRVRRAAMVEAALALGHGPHGGPRATDAQVCAGLFVLSIPVARGANWFLAGGGRRMDEEEATAAAAERIAAAAEDGTSLPVRLATDVVRFLYGGTGRREPADGGVVSASLLNAKPAVGGIGVEPRGGGVLRVLFTVASDAVADTVVRWRHELRRCVDSTAVFDVLSDREEAQHQALWPAFLAAKVAGKRAQFHRARLVVDGERGDPRRAPAVPAPAPAAPGRPPAPPAVITPMQLAQLADSLPSMSAPQLVGALRSLREAAPTRDARERAWAAARAACLRAASAEPQHASQLLWEATARGSQAPAAAAAAFTEEEGGQARTQAPVAEDDAADGPAHTSEWLAAMAELCVCDGAARLGGARGLVLAAAALSRTRHVPGGTWVARLAAELRACGLFLMSTGELGALLVAVGRMGARGSVGVLPPPVGRGGDGGDGAASGGADEVAGGSSNAERVAALAVAALLDDAAAEARGRMRGARSLGNVVGAMAEARALLGGGDGDSARVPQAECLWLSAALGAMAPLLRGARVAQLAAACTAVARERCAPSAEWVGALQAATGRDALAGASAGELAALAGSLASVPLPREGPGGLEPAWVASLCATMQAAALPALFASGSAGRLSWEALSAACASLQVLEASSMRGGSGGAAARLLPQLAAAAASRLPGASTAQLGALGANLIGARLSPGALQHMQALLPALLTAALALLIKQQGRPLVEDGLAAPGRSRDEPGGGDGAGGVAAAERDACMLAAIVAADGVLALHATNTGARGTLPGLLRAQLSGVARLAAPRLERLSLPQLAVVARLAVLDTDTDADGAGAADDAAGAGVGAYVDAAGALGSSRAEEHPGGAPHADHPLLGDPPGAWPAVRDAMARDLCALLWLLHERDGGSGDAGGIRGGDSARARGSECALRLLAFERAPGAGGARFAAAPSLVLALAGAHGVLGGAGAGGSAGVAAACGVLGAMGVRPSAQLTDALLLALASSAASSSGPPSESPSESGGAESVGQSGSGEPTPAGHATAEEGSGTPRGGSSSGSGAEAAGAPDGSSDDALARAWHTSLVSLADARAAASPAGAGAARRALAALMPRLRGASLHLAPGLVAGLARVCAGGGGGGGGGDAVATTAAGVARADAAGAEADDLLRSLRARLPALGPDGCGALLASCALLGHVPDDGTVTALWGAVAGAVGIGGDESAGASARGTAGGTAGISAGGIAALLTGAAALQLRPDLSLLVQLMEALERPGMLEAASGAQLAAVLTALLRLGARPPQSWLALVTDRLLAPLSEPTQQLPEPQQPRELERQGHPGQGQQGQQQPPLEDPSLVPGRSPGGGGHASVPACVLTAAPPATQRFALRALVSLGGSVSQASLSAAAPALAAALAAAPPEHAGPAALSLARLTPPPPPRLPPRLAPLAPLLPDSVSDAGSTLWPPTPWEARAARRIADSVTQPWARRGGEGSGGSGSGTSGGGSGGSRGGISDGVARDAGAGVVSVRLSRAGASPGYGEARMDAADALLSCGIGGGVCGLEYPVDFAADDVVRWLADPDPEEVGAGGEGGEGDGAHMAGDGAHMDGVQMERDGAHMEGDGARMERDEAHMEGGSGGEDSDEGEEEAGLGAGEEQLGKARAEAQAARVARAAMRDALVSSHVRDAGALAAMPPGALADALAALLAWRTRLPRYAADALAARLATPAAAAGGDPQQPQQRGRGGGGGRGAARATERKLASPELLTCAAQLLAAAATTDDEVYDDGDCGGDSAGGGGTDSPWRPPPGLLLALEAASLPWLRAQAAPAAVWLPRLVRALVTLRARPSTGWLSAAEAAAARALPGLDAQQAADVVACLACLGAGGLPGRGAALWAACEAGALCGGGDDRGGGGDGGGGLLSAVAGAAMLSQAGAAGMGPPPRALLDAVLAAVCADLAFAWRPCPDVDLPGLLSALSAWDTPPGSRLLGQTLLAALYESAEDLTSGELAACLAAAASLSAPRPIPSASADQPESLGAVSPPPPPLKPLAPAPKWADRLAFELWRPHALAACPPEDLARALQALPILGHHPSAAWAAAAARRLGASRVDGPAAHAESRDGERSTTASRLAL
ncbi:hypothetical protein FOA52_006202 [Chlamydomonas sp. UWO 241]|nr:hypothetical protein FOA52_006202 [Chlamydomonas sp. UWO 241]